MRFLSSFYVLNFILLLSYPVARLWFVSRELTNYSRLAEHAGLLHWVSVDAVQLADAKGRTVSQLDHQQPDLRRKSMLQECLQ
jgi:hypothetical protein